MNNPFEDKTNAEIIQLINEYIHSERMMYDSDASYARGRGSQANRDSMGRYSSRSYDTRPYGYDNVSYRGNYDSNYGMRQGEMR